MNVTIYVTERMIVILVMMIIVTMKPTVPANDVTKARLQQHDTDVLTTWGNRTRPVRFRCQLGGPSVLEEFA